MVEAFVSIPRAVMIALMGSAGPVDVASFVWASVIVVWAVLAAAVILRRAWQVVRWTMPIIQRRQNVQGIYAHRAAGQR